MESILVGIDGTERGQKALDWAVCRALEGDVQLHLISVLDADIEREIGLDPDQVLRVAEESLASQVVALTEAHPGLSVEGEVARGDVVNTLSQAADQHDLIVLGTHHGRTVGKTVGGAKGLQISIATKTPTVVVPCDWDMNHQGSGITVGVGSDSASVPAIEFGASEAMRCNTSLRLVSAWGLPPLLSRSAEAMGGGLQPVGQRFQRTLDSLVGQLHDRYPNLEVSGEAIEGASPTKVLLEECKESALLVLGTHSRSPLGRIVFGSVTHSLLLNLVVPTVVVPVK